MMHMADALISPAVGGVMLAASMGIAAYSGYRVKKELNEKKIPLMGVMGAFIFAAQMINFSIPGTGSSGHLGGGLILASILGPYAGFLSMTVILLIQALVFADGGLLAYGCNIFNLGFFASFIVYPFIYKSIVGQKKSPLRIMIASITGAIAGLQLGAFSVVVETVLSGKAELPFVPFLLVMQPIHLAIGAVEGLVTGAILAFIQSARPEMLEYNQSEKSSHPLRTGNIILLFGLLAVLTGGIFAWFASSNPDGLEWSLLKVTGKEKLESDTQLHKTLLSVQESTSILPDYALKVEPSANGRNEGSSTGPNINVGTSFSGIIGSIIVFGSIVLVAFIIWLIKRSKRTVFRKQESSGKSRLS
jgi:cobalt/nickel transport system permease protein